MQLTLDLIIPKEDVAKTANYQHPLKNFRDLAIANGSIFKEDDMGALRQFCRKHGLNQAGWRFLNRYGKSAYAALFSMVDDIDCIFEIALCYINWVRDKQPAFDRNQWRSGWGAIRRNYQKWQRLNPEPGIPSCQPLNRYDLLR